MKSKLLALAVFLFIFQLAFPQLKIIGYVVESDSKEPIEYANIALMKPDSTFIKGTTTNNKGNFTFNNISNNDYLLSIVYMGYRKEYVKVNLLNKDINIGTISLHPSETALKDVIVTGNAVIQKIDRQVIVPTAAQVKSSNSGLSLLQNLQLPRIYIDPLNNKINISGGGDVQLRINGVQVEIADITALQPGEIVRIEYHDNPGLRYGNAAAVIDYITRRKESGGSISTNLQNALSNIGFAEDHLSGKVNHKKSEFGVNTYFRYRKIDWTRENEDSFIFPDKRIDRLEEGSPTEFNQKQLNVRLNYSLMEKDKYYFNATIRNNFDDQPYAYSDRQSVLYTSNNPVPLTINDHSTWKSNTPSLDLYYQRNLKNNQLIIFNAVGTYIDSKNTRLYQEHRGDEINTNIYSSITGDKYSLILEGIYEKQFKDSKLSGGIKHTQSYTDNQYSGSTSANIGMNVAESYAYTEYQFKKGKFNYSFGVGASRVYYSQGGNDQETYTFRPSMRISYNINDNAYIRYNGYISSYAPSLSDLNNVEQAIDSLQIRRGNPNLKSTWFISNTINAGFKKGIFNVDFFARYSYDNKPVMSEVLFENGKFVQTMENQKYFHRINTEVTFKMQPLKEHLTFSITPGLNRYISGGNNYTHTHTNWFFRSSLNANYKNWSLMAEYYGRYNWLWGESLSRGELIHILGIGYNKPKWSLSVGAINPFEKTYYQTSRNLSALTPSKSNISTDNISPMFFVNFTLNLNFGRQYNGGNKRLNNNDSDAGIMQGTK